MEGIDTSKSIMFDAEMVAPYHYATGGLQPRLFIHADYRNDIKEALRAYLKFSPMDDNGNKQKLRVILIPYGAEDER